MKSKFLWLVSLWPLLVVSAYGGKSIVVDLTAQTATAYEDGRTVFSGQISTGTAKRPTPTGHFRVLEKDIDHISSSWPKPNGGAKMHYMLRVTHYGIAMHLGFVPNYPASHGCIRMQNGFAQKMYAWARVGTPVQVKGHAPTRVVRHSLVSRRSYRPVVSKKYIKMSALNALSGLPPKQKKIPVAAKKVQKKVSEYASSHALKKPYVEPTALELMSTSPKVVKKVKKMQHRKDYTNQPLRKKAPKLSPLEAMRV